MHPPPILCHKPLQPRAPRSRALTSRVSLLWCTDTRRDVRTLHVRTLRRECAAGRAAGRAAYGRGCTRAGAARSRVLPAKTWFLFIVIVACSLAPSPSPAPRCAQHARLTHSLVYVVGTRSHTRPPSAQRSTQTDVVRRVCVWGGEPLYGLGAGDNLDEVVGHLGLASFVVVHRQLINQIGGAASEARANETARQGQTRRGRRNHLRRRRTAENGERASK